MKLANLVDPTRCWQLTSGVLGIYFSYLVTGIIHESMLKEKYLNWKTNQQEVFTWPSGFLIFPCAITWIMGAIVNRIQIQPQDRVEIPTKNSLLCAITVAISTLTYTYAIYLSNFPVVMMFKSCNILSVILVGVMCSRVKDKKLKLGMKKIIVGIIVTAGIIMFKVFDPESAHKDEKKTEMMGIVLLVASLLADGFLPDFQAQIKSVYKPQPMEMMTAINKWVAIVAFLYSCILTQTWSIAKFMLEHRLFVVHMVGMGVLSAVGQMFVYRMIKQFKQHFPPFVITTRKIFTVGLSIIYYKHETNYFQLLGLIMVFAIVTYEFVAELVQEKEKQRLEQEELIKNSISAAIDQQSESAPLQPVQATATLTEEEISAKEQELYEARLQPNNQGLINEAQ